MHRRFFTIKENNIMNFYDILLTAKVAKENEDNDLS